MYWNPILEDCFKVQLNLNEQTMYIWNSHVTEMIFFNLGESFI